VGDFLQLIGALEVRLVRAEFAVSTSEARLQNAQISLDRDADGTSLDMSCRGTISADSGLYVGSVMPKQNACETRSSI